MLAPWTRRLRGSTIPRIYGAPLFAPGLRGEGRTVPGNIFEGIFRDFLFTRFNAARNCSRWVINEAGLIVSVYGSKANWIINAGL